MVPVPGRLDAVARLGELKVLDELEGAFDKLLDGASLALFLNSALAGEPVR